MLKQYSSMEGSALSGIWTSINLESFCSKFILLHQAFQKHPTAGSTSTSSFIPTKHCVWSNFLWLGKSQLPHYDSEGQCEQTDQKPEKSPWLSSIEHTLSFCSPPNTHAQSSACALFCTEHWGLLSSLQLSFHMSGNWKSLCPFNSETDSVHFNDSECLLCVDGPTLEKMVFLH